MQYFSFKDFPTVSVLRKTFIVGWRVHVDIVDQRLSQRLKSGVCVSRVKSVKAAVNKILLLTMDYTITC